MGLIHSPIGDTILDLHLALAWNSVVFQWSVAAHGTSAGRNTVKVVPLPGKLFTSIFPPCWRMIPNALDSVLSDLSFCSVPWV